MLVVACLSQIPSQRFYLSIIIWSIPTITMTADTKPNQTYANVTCATPVSPEDMSSNDGTPDNISTVLRDEILGLTTLLSILKNQLSKPDHRHNQKTRTVDDSLIHIATLLNTDDSPSNLVVAVSGAPNDFMNLTLTLVTSAGHASTAVGTSPETDSDKGEALAYASISTPLSNPFVI